MVGSGPGDELTFNWVMLKKTYATVLNIGTDIKLMEHPDRLGCVNCSSVLMHPISLFVSEGKEKQLINLQVAAYNG